MSDRIQAEVNHHFAQSAQQVYDCWLNGNSIRKWMQAALQAMGLPGDLRTVEVDARVGGKFCFSDVRPMGEAFHWGTYQQLDCPREIAFSWNAGDCVTETDDQLSLVTISLVDTPTGCDVRLVHSMDTQWIDYLERTQQGWANMLDHIDQWLSTRNQEA